MNTATALALTLATATLASAQALTPDEPGIETRRSLNALDLAAAPFDIEAGLVGGPEDCSPAIDCAQPGDFAVFINASFFDCAEVMEFAADGTLTRLCTTFVFAGGSCPGDPEDPTYSMNWAWEFYAIDASGVPSTAPPARFDTDAPLANMTAEPVFTGVIGAGFPVFYFAFDLLGGGHPVSAGECLALQPKFDLPGCSAFWETSSNEDGSPTGDGLFLQDALMDGYDTCDYTANDLLLCLDALTTQPPTCTANISIDAPVNDNCEGAAMAPLVCDATNIHCLLFATQNTQDDPALPCALGEPDGFTGHPTVFYTFTPTSSRALLSMCRVSDGQGNFPGNAPFPNGDFVLAVYEYAQSPGAGEGPCDLVQIACSDNNCNENKPYLCLNDLDPMTTYVVEVAGHSEIESVQFELDVTCTEIGGGPFGGGIPEIPINDDCINAIPLTFPFIDEMSPSDALDPTGLIPTGNTTCATLDPIAGSCGGTVNGNSPGVWYTFMGTGMEVVVEPCGDSHIVYAAQMNVYCGDCTTGLICLAGRDDDLSCTPGTDVMLCTEAGRQYYIYVHGNFDVGDFSLLVRNNSNFEGFCTPDPAHTPLCELTTCPGDCDKNGTVEFNDLVAMLFEFGASPPIQTCDTDDSGSVEFNDLVTALFLFGDCEDSCP